MGDDTISTVLIFVIACLLLAVSIVGSPRTAELTPEQMNLLPLWGP